MSVHATRIGTIAGIRMLGACVSAVAGVLSASAALAQDASTSTPPSATLGTHVALVVGNGRFAEPHGRPQPALDAAAAAERLMHRGFTLVEARDGTCKSGGAQVDLPLDALRAALACLEKAAAGTVQAVLYFSGTTIGTGDEIYLVPADVPLSSRPDPAALVALKPVLAGLDAAKSQLPVVVVDGARHELSDAGFEAPGTKHLPAATAARIVLVSASAAGTSQAPASPPSPAPGPEAAPGVAAAPPATTALPSPEPPKDATKPEADGLSRLTRRLVGVLDSELGERAMGEAGMPVARLLEAVASPPDKSQDKPSLVLAIDKVTGTDMLGRMPSVGSGMCDILRWRAATFKNCVELAAAYESCGEESATRDRLKSACAKDWDALMRHRLRSSLAATMKSNTCQSFNTLVARFEGEPSVQALSEYKELASLAKYSCALEAQERIKSAYASLVTSRDCKGVEAFIASNPTLDAETRANAEKLAQEVCCSSVSLKGECISNDAAMTKVIGLLSKKGCDLGNDKKTKAKRIAFLIDANVSDPAKAAKPDGKRVTLDDSWAALDKLTGKDCACKKRAVDSSTGACKLGAKP